MKAKVGQNSMLGCNFGREARKIGCTTCGILLYAIFHNDHFAPLIIFISSRLLPRPRQQPCCTVRFLLLLPYAYPPGSTVGTIGAIFPSSLSCSTLILPALRLTWLIFWCHLYLVRVAPLPNVSTSLTFSNFSVLFRSPLQFIYWRWC